MISYSLARLSSEGAPTLIAGSLSTQPRYQLEPGRWEKPTPALKDAYADLVKRMKRHLRRHEGQWIAPSALALLLQGQVRLPPGLAPGSASGDGAPLPDHEVKALSRVRFCHLRDQPAREGQAR